MSTGRDLRLPPQNIEAEESLLGSVLLDNDVLHEVIAHMRAEDFYRDANQILYRRIEDLYRADKAVDAVTLAEELIRHDEFVRVGGDATLAKIAGSAPHAANALHYLHIVLQKAVARELIEAGQQIVANSYAGQQTAEQQLSHAMQLLFSVLDRRSPDATVSAGAAISRAMDRLDNRNRGPSGIGTGIFGLDSMTDGFQPEQLIILAARPSIGKTALALNFMEYSTIARGDNVLFVSLEMNVTELGERMIVSRAGVENWKLKDPERLEQAELGALGAASAEWRQSGALIDDSPSRTLMQITANARKWRARHGLALLIIDYLQLITPEGGGNRQEEVAIISRGLKTLGRELKIPVLCLSQLSRKTEQREHRRPSMADLRESGAIENDADLVLLLHRPDYYDPNDRPGEADLIVAKNRNGETGTVKLRFLRRVGRFEEPAETFVEPGVF